MAKKWRKLTDLQTGIEAILAHDPKAKWVFTHGEGVYSLDFKLSRGVKLTHDEIGALDAFGISADDEEGMTPAQRIAGGLFMLLDDTFGQG